jgi:glycosyltransferase involved in cell wall biosynthesis
MRRLRILHVVGSMTMGGIEMWLMHVMRNIDRTCFQMDFLISNRSQSPLVKEIEELGGKVLICMAHSQPKRYALNLARALAIRTRYDVVHSHLHHLNGVVALVATLGGARVRIVHSHTAISGGEADAAGFHVRRYRVAQTLMKTFATGALACSDNAGSALFGADWKSQPNRRVLVCGIDLEPFRLSYDRAEVRSELGIPSDAVVIGHAGRFVREKNHSLFFDVADAYAALDPQAHFLLVGDGPLLENSKKRAARSPFANRFHFVGRRYDVPRLMVGAMDCFLFPSHVEGAPVVLIEAQAAGLPCVISDVIPTQTDVVPSSLYRMSLQQPPEQWARSIKQALVARNAESRLAAPCAVAASPFNIARSLHELQQYYFELAGFQANPSKHHSEGAHRQ